MESIPHWRPINLPGRRAQIAADAYFQGRRDAVEELDRHLRDWLRADPETQRRFVRLLDRGTIAPPALRQILEAMVYE